MINIEIKLSVGRSHLRVRGMPHLMEFAGPGDPGEEAEERDRTGYSKPMDSLRKST